jgi:hypothetical protein
LKRSLIYGLVLFFFVVSGFVGNSDKDGELRRRVASFGQAYVRLPVSDQIQIERLTADFSISQLDDKSLEICVSPLTLDSFIALGYDYEIVDLSEPKAVVSASTLEEAMLWESYPTYQQYLDIVELFADSFPDICIVDTIGSSVRGRKVLALKISDNAGTDEDEPRVFYSSTMHGDELGSYVLMLRLAEYLLVNYGIDEEVNRLVDNIEIYINPLANPDGTYYNGDTITSPTRANANGYDLNRNFPYLTGTNSRPLQKETIEMMDFMRDRNFVLSANFHAGKEVVNYPWDSWKSIDHADETWFYGISRQYADTAHAYSPSGYMTYKDNGVTKGADWYVIYGGRQDYVTYFLGGREITIELDNTKQTPASDLDLLWSSNRKSLLGYLGNALFGVTGKVTDSITGSPLGAKVFVLEHDKDSSHVYSDTITGRYRRMLAPGNYDILFTCEGYTDKSFKVDLAQKQLIDLDVSLVPVGYPPEEPEVPEVPEEPIYNEDTEQKGLLALFPNPVKKGTDTKVYLPALLRGDINMTLYDIKGARIWHQQLIVVDDSPLDIDFSFLSPGLYLLLVENGSNGQRAVSRLVVVD